ncbi:MAG: FlgD immunoglobulin-like domain containing protein [candidate division WOR-3 bacterium]|nr:FlgD immunoglobulin-like domain containing protein [candidate division WOR-3 bacterium]
MTKQRAKASLLGIVLFLFATVLAAQVTEEWVARYDGPASGVDEARDIAVDGAGNVYVTGWSYDLETQWDYATVKYSQGPGVAEASPDVSGHRLEVAQLTPEPVITYTLSSSSSISLKLYDVTGKLVRTLVTGSQEAGIHTITWDATDYPAGLYFVRLRAGDCYAAVKTILTK